MKKLLSIAILVGLMSVNAVAGNYIGASIDSIKIKADGTVRVVVTPAGGSVANLFDLSTATADGQKAVLAALLTAKSTTGTADIRFSGTSITEVSY